MNNEENLKDIWGHKKSPYLCSVKIKEKDENNNNKNYTNMYAFAFIATVFLISACLYMDDKFAEEENRYKTSTSDTDSHIGQYKKAA